MKKHDTGYIVSVIYCLEDVTNPPFSPSLVLAHSKKKAMKFVQEELDAILKQDSMAQIAKQDIPDGPTDDESAEDTGENADEVAESDDEEEITVEDGPKKILRHYIVRWVADGMASRTLIDVYKIQAR